ncbi:hypothetical protein LCGC14_1468610 [marine sediment metagenome]|uniref:Uncharacterized protein n=1 Tax=marine sediment metagenome TaxID=412755 RepID=A0A0F9MEV4_9ZZZZ
MIVDKENVKTGWLERPGNIRRLKVAFGIVLGLLAALDFSIHKHAYFHLENLPGFYVIYGFISCAMIVAVSKVLGKLLLLANEGYYDD